MYVQMRFNTTRSNLETYRLTPIIFRFCKVFRLPIALTGIIVERCVGYTEIMFLGQYLLSYLFIAIGGLPLSVDFHLGTMRGRPNNKVFVDSNKLN